MVNFSTQNIVDIMDTVREKLSEYGYSGESKLTVYVFKDTFRKIDEDLYYRQFPDGKDFVPSKGELFVTSGPVCLEVHELSPPEAS